MEGKNLIALKLVIAMMILMAFIVCMEAKMYCCGEFPGVCCPNPCCERLKELGYKAVVSQGPKLP